MIETIGISSGFGRNRSANGRRSDDNDRLLVGECTTTIGFWSGNLRNWSASDRGMYDNIGFWSGCRCKRSANDREVDEHRQPSAFDRQISGNKTIKSASVVGPTKTRRVGLPKADVANRVDPDDDPRYSLHRPDHAMGDKSPFGRRLPDVDVLLGCCDELH